MKQTCRSIIHQCCMASLLSLGISLILLNPAGAQDIRPTIADSTKSQSISLEKIPASASETLIKTAHTGESLIKQAQIDLLKKENDSLLAGIDSILLQQKKMDYSSYSNRQLINQLITWTELKKVLARENDKLSGTIKTINDNQNSLEKDLKLWGDTKEKQNPEAASSTIRSLISEVIDQIDTVNKTMVSKSDELFRLLRNTSHRSVDIEDMISRIKSIISDRQANIFLSTEPSIFSLNYTDREQWQLMHYMKLFYKTDIRVFINYYRNNLKTFLYYYFYLGILVLLFLYFRKKIHKLKIESPTIYETAAREILDKPISSALVLGLFSSVLIFKSRPLIFTDISTMLASIPLIIIVLKIIEKRGHKYVYFFVCLILLRFINFILPPETVLHRFNIFIMGITEIMVFIDMIKLIRNREFRSSVLQSFIVLALLAHVAIVFIGLIGNILGSVMMADIAVNLAIADAFIGLLLYITVIIVIGTIHLIIDGGYLDKSNIIRNYGAYLKKQSVRLVITIAVLFWLDTILKVLGLNDNVYGFFQHWMTKEYGLGTDTFTFGSIFLFFFVVWLSVLLSKIIRIILEEDVLERIQLKKGVPRMIAIMTRYTLVIVGVFIAVSAAGMPIDRLTIIFGAFSVGIGFGLQNIFNNLVSGLILLVERPIQIGDVVEVGQLMGKVKTMGIRSSNLRTFDGAEVIVPNGQLISNEVTNWTLTDQRRRIEIFSGVAYGSDVHKVQKLFLKLLDEHPEVLKDPSPNVFFNDLGESSLDFRLLFWTENFDEWLRIRSEVIFRIHDVLYEEGIEIPFPQRDLHIRSVDGNVNIDAKNDVKT